MRTLLGIVIFLVAAIVFITVVLPWAGAAIVDGIAPR
jgi:hypothetical protein